MKTTYAIRVGWLIDGSGGPVQKDKTLLLKNGIIQDIVSSLGRKTEIPVLDDYKKCTVIPGLIDAHVHLCLPSLPKPQTDSLTSASYLNLCKAISQRRKQLLKWGVVAVRDGGDKNSTMPAYKQDFGHDTKCPVEIQVAETAWHSPNRYGGLIGRTPPENTQLTKAMLKTSVKVDHLKIINSGLNSLTHFGRETDCQFEAGILKEVVAQAHANGLKTMIHANGKKPVHDAISAGCDSIEHGFFMGSENLERMAEKSITWVPTAGTMQVLSSRFKPASIEADTAKRNLEHQLKLIELARRLGVNIALGTDAGGAGVVHGQSVATEFAFLMEAGFTLTEAVKCATANGADLMDIQHLGRLIPGKAATLVAIEGPPRKLEKKMGDITAVYVDGVCRHT
jgi:imidazolonepropionase-like amidohydrolase